MLIVTNERIHIALSALNRARIISGCVPLNQPVQHFTFSASLIPRRPCRQMYRFFKAFPSGIPPDSQRPWAWQKAMTVKNPVAIIMPRGAFRTCWRDACSALVRCQPALGHRHAGVELNWFPRIILGWNQLLHLYDIGGRPVWNGVPPHWCRPAAMFVWQISWFLDWSTPLNNMESETRV